MPNLKNQEIVIKRSNDLIEARYRLTIEEQRLVLLLSSVIHQDDEDFKDYEIRVSDFVIMFGLEKRKNIYKDVEDAARELSNKRIDLSKDGKKIYASWLSYVEYVEGSGVVRLRFDKSLKPYLLQLKNCLHGFTQYNLSTVLNFKSSYSIRLYELLKMEVWKAEKKGERQFEKSFEVMEYRQLLGVDKKSYPLFADFRRWVIEPPVKEISELTDLSIFETNYIKTGKKITSISFAVLIRSKKERTPEKEEISEMETEKQEIHKAVQALMDNGFSFENAKTYKTKYGVKQIERSLAYMQAEERNGKKINNRPAYLAAAIREDWGQYQEAEMKEKAEKEAKRQEAERKAQENQTTLEQQIKEKYRKTFEDFEKMEKTKKEELIFEYSNNVADSFSLEQMRKAEKKGESIFTASIVKSTFTKFLISKGL